MNIRTQLLKVMAAEVGVREEGGNNKGARIFEYGRATWLPEAAIVAGVPWCAACVAFGLSAALVNAGVPIKTAESWRCRDASAFGWITWAQRAPGCRVLAPKELPDPGDIVVYDFNGPAAGGGHIGVVESVIADGTFVAIEGNTPAAPATLAEERDSGRGDGVMRKTRTPRHVVNFIRIPEALP